MCLKWRLRSPAWAKERTDPLSYGWLENRDEESRGTLTYLVGKCTRPPKSTRPMGPPGTKGTRVGGPYQVVVGASRARRFLRRQKQQTQKSTRSSNKRGWRRRSARYVRN